LNNAVAKVVAQRRLNGTGDFDPALQAATASKGFQAFLNANSILVLLSVLTGKSELTKDAVKSALKDAFFIGVTAAQSAQDNVIEFPQTVADKAEITA
jgi:copper(I)-binding protein